MGRVTFATDAHRRWCWQGCPASLMRCRCLPWGEMQPTRLLGVTVFSTKNCDLGDLPWAYQACLFPQDLAWHLDSAGWWRRESDHQWGWQSCVLLPPQELFGGCHPGGGKAWSQQLQSCLGQWGDCGVWNSRSKCIIDFVHPWKGFQDLREKAWDCPLWGW